MIKDGTRSEVLDNMVWLFSTKSLFLQVWCAHCKCLAPTAWLDLSPDGASSMTRQSLGSTPQCSAAKMCGSGWGLPRATLLEVTTKGSAMCPQSRTLSSNQITSFYTCHLHCLEHIQEALDTDEVQPHLWYDNISCGFILFICKQVRDWVHRAPRYSAYISKSETGCAAHPDFLLTYASQKLGAPHTQIFRLRMQVRDWVRRTPRFSAYKFLWAMRPVVPHM